MLHSQGDLVGGPPWFGELEMHLHRFWYHSLTPISICMFLHVHLFIACFVIHYAYAMLIRIVLYMFSYLSTHVSYGSIFSVLTLFRTNMYALDLMHIHLHYDHLDVYDYMMICFNNSCFYHVDC